MPEGGLEPPRFLQLQILSLVRLPIPSLGPCSQQHTATPIRNPITPAARTSNPIQVLSTRRALRVSTIDIVYSVLAGVRTQDLEVKSHLLYRLSYEYEKLTVSQFLLVSCFLKVSLCQTEQRLNFRHCLHGLLLQRCP